MVRVDDTVIRVVIIRIFRDDDRATSFDLVEVEGVFLFLFEFDIFIEEADVLLADIFIFVAVAILDDLFFDLVQAHPGKKILIKFTALVDVILEMYANLLDKILRICLKIPKFRVFHIIAL